jgi:hypothetical protein
VAAAGSLQPRCTDVVEAQPPLPDERELEAVGRL